MLPGGAQVKAKTAAAGMVGTSAGVAAAGVADVAGGGAVVVVVVADVGGGAVVAVVAVVVGWGLLGRVVLLLGHRLARRLLRTWLEEEGGLAGGRQVAFPRPAPAAHSVSDAVVRGLSGKEWP